MIQPKEFERCFRSWVSEVCQRIEGGIVSIDGKTVRGSGDKERSPLHMVNAWAHQQQLVLGQVATDAKSNEITAIPNLLDVLEIAGCIITIDAMGCQKDIVRKIVQKEADYVLGLKGNQPTLHQATEEYFHDALDDKSSYPEVQHKLTTDKGHGRIEVRNYYLTTNIDWLSGHEEWRGMNALGMVRARVTRGEKVTEETRFYITSLTYVEPFSNAVRAHWGIENSLHWCLDVTFGEDDSRIRKDHSAENMAVVRQMALNILKQHPEKISLARKRRRCAYDDVWLADLLLSIMM